MKIKECIIVIQDILSSLGEDGSNFKINNDVAFLKPIGECYRGFCSNRSQLDKNSFSVEVFLSPLYIPTKDLGFNLGWSLMTDKNYYKWTGSDHKVIAEKLRDKALPFLRKGSDPKMMIEAISSLGKKDDPQTLQALVAVGAKAKNDRIVKDSLKRLRKRLSEDPFEWQKKLLERVEWIANAYFNKDKQLEEKFAEWTAESISNLKLSKYCPIE